MTGHTIAKHLERLGVPEGFVVYWDERNVWLDDVRGTAGHWRQGPAETWIDISADHPRAMEAAALLLRAYRDARLAC